MKHILAFCKRKLTLFDKKEDKKNLKRLRKEVKLCKTK